MERTEYLANRRAAFRGRFGMPTSKARLFAKLAGKCLRCLTRPAIKWKRCQQCLEEHSRRKGR